MSLYEILALSSIRPTVSSDSGSARLLRARMEYAAEFEEDLLDSVIDYMPSLNKAFHIAVGRLKFDVIRLFLTKYRHKLSKSIYHDASIITNAEFSPAMRELFIRQLVPICYPEPPGKWLDNSSEISYLLKVAARNSDRHTIRLLHEIAVEGKDLFALRLNEFCPWISSTEKVPEDIYRYYLANIDDWEAAAYGHDEPYYPRPRRSERVRGFLEFIREDIIKTYGATGSNNSHIFDAYLSGERNIRDAMAPVCRGFANAMLDYILASPITSYRPSMYGWAGRDTINLMASAKVKILSLTLYEPEMDPYYIFHIDHIAELLNCLLEARGLTYYRDVIDYRFLDVLQWYVENCRGEMQKTAIFTLEKWQRFRDSS